jgi:protocatechuate 3,4-dioxygenase beta subunit
MPSVREGEDVSRSEVSGALEPGSISGSVVAGDTGKGVAGVQIEAYRYGPRARMDADILGLAKAGRAISDTTGRFEIRGMMPGPYLLVCKEAEGYKPQLPAPVSSCYGGGRES